MSFPKNGDNFRTLGKIPRRLVKMKDRSTQRRVEDDLFVFVSLPMPRDKRLRDDLYPVDPGAAN